MANIEASKRAVETVKGRFLLSPSEYAVFDLIRRYTGYRLGCCFLKVESIAKQVGLSVRQVQRILNRLEEYGLIKKVPRRSAKTGRQTSNLYRVLYHGSVSICWVRREWSANPNPRLTAKARKAAKYSKCHADVTPTPTGKSSYNGGSKAISGDRTDTDLKAKNSTDYSRGHKVSEVDKCQVDYIYKRIRKEAPWAPPQTKKAMSWLIRAMYVFGPQMVIDALHTAEEALINHVLIVDLSRYVWGICRNWSLRQTA